jgi:hypothetical protein
MSRVNGEKARAAIARRNRTAKRVKTRARLGELRGATASQTTVPAKSASNKTT